MSLENTQAKVPTAPKDDGPVAPAPPAGGHGAHGGINLPVLEKLKQHHVGRVALLYLGVSWIILEPVHVVFHMLDVPEWANRLVIVVIVSRLSAHGDPGMDLCRHTGDDETRRTSGPPLGCRPG